MNEDHIKQYGMRVAERVRAEVCKAAGRLAGVEWMWVDVDLQAITASVAVPHEVSAQPPVTVPDGYVLVPVEPTPEMLDAADRELMTPLSGMERGSGPGRVYRAMLSAVQKTEGVPEVKDKYSDWPELATVKLQWATDYTTGWGRRGADGKIRPIYGDDTREPLDMNCWIIIAEREAAGKKGGAA